MNTAEIINTYYSSLTQKNDKWKELWADDAIFQDASKTLNANGKDAVIASFTPFLKGVVSVSVKQLIADGNTACAIASYKYVNQKGANFDQDVAEVIELSGDKIKKLVIYFDLSAYRAFMKS